MIPPCFLLCRKVRFMEQDPHDRGIQEVEVN